eukprot:TRINITY_DN5435_c0_g3_i1.p2 TRINITY_DN5435_c0_g3~~TRINITY_DN5435_c0_g3_i1.p2  ORF type:complete len:112 (+),score=49.24 TRINITY_DN5435_c0_g3_i1:30-338(+)
MGMIFFSSRRRHTRCSGVSWARRCVQETVSTQSTWGCIILQAFFFYGIHYTFIDTGNDFLEQTFHLSNQAAGIFIAIPLVIYCFLTPYIGCLLYTSPSPRDS